MLKQWLAICLGKLWYKYDAARWCGVRDSAHDKVAPLLWDEIPEVGGAHDGITINILGQFFTCLFVHVGSYGCCVCSRYIYSQWTRQW